MYRKEIKNYMEGYYRIFTDWFIQKYSKYDRILYNPNKKFILSVEYYGVEVQLIAEAVNSRKVVFYIKMVNPTKDYNYTVRKYEMNFKDYDVTLEKAFSRHLTAVIDLIGIHNIDMLHDGDEKSGKARIIGRFYGFLD